MVNGHHRACNVSIQKVEYQALRLQGQLHNTFKASLDYKRLCLKEKKVATVNGVTKISELFQLYCQVSKLCIYNSRLFNWKEPNK